MMPNRPITSKNSPTRDVIKLIKKRFKSPKHYVNVTTKAFIDSSIQIDSLQTINSRQSAKISSLTSELAKQKGECKKHSEDQVSTKRLLLKICDEKSEIEQKYKEKIEYIRKIESTLSRGGNESALDLVNQNLKTRISDLEKQIADTNKEVQKKSDREKELILRNNALEEALVKE